MIILQKQNGEIKDAPGWLYGNELHKDAIIFPFVKHHREKPETSYPCALCGKPLGPGPFFVYSLVAADEQSNFNSYVYIHVRCMADKFKHRVIEAGSALTNDYQGCLF